MDAIIKGCSKLAERVSLINARLVQKNWKMQKTAMNNIAGNQVSRKNSDLIMKISLLFSSCKRNPNGNHYLRSYFINYSL